MKVDLFVGVNVVLFVLMCVVVYYDRLGRRPGPGNVPEFFVYACAILIVIMLAWWRVRHVPFPSWLLALIQVGILAHFAGAFVPIEGARLYDARLVGVPYDKIVHAFNGFAGAALIGHLLGLVRPPVPGRLLLVFMLVLGGGAFFEILEYLAVLIVPNTGVGGYDNNMRDLIANGFGAGLFVLVDLKRRSDAPWRAEP